MSRRQNRSSRQPGPTENEIALQWELRRLRTENTLLRRAHDEARKGSGYLSPPRRSEFARKVIRLWDNCVVRAVPEAELCDHCGGISPERMDVAAQQWVVDIAVDEMDHCDEPAF